MEDLSLAQFRDRGYQIVRDVVDDRTIELVRSFLERAAKDALERIRHSLPFATIDQLLVKIDALHRTGEIEALDPELAKLLSGHLLLAARLDPICWMAVRSRAMRGLVERLFPGQKLHMHMPPSARYVLPGNRHAMVPAHQDITYNKHMPKFVTVWVPFVPIDECCGGVAVHVGTHKTPEMIHGERKGFWFEPIHPTRSEVVGCEVPLGGALLLSDSIVHESMANHSDWIRYSVDYRFFGDGGSTKHYLDLDTMEVIAPRA